MTSVAVLMTCFNRVETTLRCLQALYRQDLSDDIRLDVWLVDDASPDKTGERVRKSFPEVNVILGAGNLFWCKGMRLAWDTASKAKNYDAYLWLNDDTMLVDGALQSLVDDWENLPEGNLGIVVGTCAADRIDGELSYGCRDANGVIRPNGTPQPVESEAMSGNVVLVPRKVYEAIGPIYGGYSHAFGDRDYSLMLKRNGGLKYVSSRVIGICPQQPERYMHLDNMRLGERVKTLFHPKGFSLHDMFILRLRHKGVLRAIISAVHIVLRVTIFYKGH